MMDPYVEMWLQDYFKTRAELKKDLEVAIENMEQGGYHEEADKLKQMDWNELMKFKDL